MSLFTHRGTREEGISLERKMSLDWIFDFLNFEVLAEKTTRNRALELEKICTVHMELRPEL